MNIFKISVLSERVNRDEQNDNVEEDFDTDDNAGSTAVDEEALDNNHENVARDNARMDVGESDNSSDATIDVLDDNDEEETIDSHLKKVAETKKKLAELQDDDKKKIDNERKLVADMKQILEQTETEYDEKVKKEKERRDAKIEAIYEYMEVVFEEDINQSDRELNDQELLLVADLQQAIEESDRAYEDYVKEQKEIRDAKIEAISETYFKGKEAMMNRRERADSMITKTKEQNKTAKRKYIEMVFEEDNDAQLCNIIELTNGT